MKGFYQCGVFIAILMSGCTKETAVGLVSKSLVYHGGTEAWQAIDSIAYKKEEWLYRENGDLEKYSQRFYVHSLTRDLPISLSYSDQDSTRIVRLNSNGLWVNFEIANKEKQHLENSLQAAPYTLCQPYKLLADADQLIRLPNEFWQKEGIEVFVVGIDYINPDGSPGNSWKYYFNADTYRLEGAMVHHGTTYSFIKNEAFENQTGLSLNAERTSYRCDSLRNIQFVRARYKYTYTDVYK